MDERRWSGPSVTPTMGPDNQPSEATMTQLAALIGILLIIVAIPFGLMLAPLALGVVMAFLAWRHVAAAWQPQVEEGLA